MSGYPCTNPEGCSYEMQDRGNYYFCTICGNLVMKLPDRRGPWMPLPRQASFLNQRQRHALYVGGVGSGKTMSGAYKAIYKALDHPGGQGLIGAQTFPQLRDATMHTFFEVCPEKLMWGGSKSKAFNKGESILTLLNEHQILFRQLDDESKLRSLNLVWFWIDEASEVPVDIFYQLQSRLRSMKGFAWYEDDDNNESAHQGWVTSNPNGKDWLWELFVAQNDDDYFWVNAPTKENKYLPKGFEENLRRKWPEQWVKRFLDGSFDVFEGQIYPMLDHVLHSAIQVPDFDDHIHQVPSGWPVFVSLDHGLTNPTAIGFYTIAPNEDVIKFDELAESNKPVSYHSAMILMKLAEWGVNPSQVMDWVIDPSTKGQRGMEGRAVLDVYHDYGIPFRPANNQVHAGILQVIEYLMPNPFTGRPKFYIHRRCINTYREMAAYRWKPRPASSNVNEPEEPVKKDDHNVDETRYMLMTRPKINLLKAASPLEQFKKRSPFELNEKNLPFALRSNSNFNKSGQSNQWRW